MWINREVEKNIKTYSKEFAVVIVTGARQVGKTSILTHLFPEIEYVNLDDPQQAANAENSPEEFLDNLKTPVIIDEVQYAPGLFRYLKMIVDKSKKKGQYFLTGSQQFSLMQNVAESLAGRCGVVNLYTLSAAELQGMKRKMVLEDIIVKGGYPDLYVSAINFQHWYPSYISTYLERDVRNIVNVSNLRDFNRFIRALAIRTGQVLSLSDLARDVGVAPNTIKSWISILQASQNIYLLEPYYENRGKRLVKSPKIYFCDTGLAIYLMGLNSWSDIKKSAYAGAIWETYVFNQILRHFINRGEINLNLWFWRTNIGDEVDFLIEKAGRFYAIECKLTENPSEKDTKGFKSLKNYYGENCIIKAFLACKVKENYRYNKEIQVANFIDCSFFE